LAPSGRSAFAHIVWLDAIEFLITPTARTWAARCVGHGWGI